MNEMLKKTLEAVRMIQTAVNQIEIKGAKNASIIAYCDQRCEEIAGAILEEASGEKIQNGECRGEG